MRKITGQAVYTYDINPAHVGETSFVYMGKITCPYPHAKIVSIDSSKAEAAGYTVLTAKDFPAFSLFGSGRPHLPLPPTETLYPGQMVAVVGAPTTDEVEDAIDLVDVKFDPLPYVLDAEEATKPGSPQLWPDGNIPGAGYNPETGPVPATLHVEYGDVDTALANADQVVTTKLDFPLHQHYEMEPRACVASWKNNTLTIWASNQWVHIAQAIVAGYFRMPLNNVTVKSALGGTEGGGVVGMALGDKVSGEELVLSSFMSMKVGAAVKYGPTRFDQALNNTSARFPIRAYLKFGGTKDGTMTAMQGQFYVNVGAYGGSNGSDSLSDFYNAYVTPNVRLDSTSVNTNAFAYAGPMRDVGEGQAHFFMEVAVDMLAEKLGIDPVQFRLKNMRTKDTAVDPVANLPYTGFGQPEAFNKAVQAFAWSSKFKGFGVASQVSGTTRRGVGIALLNAAKGSIIPPSTGQIQVSPDGSVTVFTGLMDHGAGGNTTFPLMAAEYLGLTSLDNVSLVQSDTSLTTNSSVTAGSQATRNAGMAFSMAVADLKRQWFPTVAAKLGVSADKLSFSNGYIVSTDDATVKISFKDAAALLTAPVKGVGVFAVPTNKAWRVGGAKLVEVEVDIETGASHVITYVSGMDIGKVIFAKGAESQVRGGFYGMGLGEANFQELLQDPTTGSYINPNFHDFRIPTIMETPDTVIPTWEEYVDPIGPFGAKGIGENVLIAVSPAVANALSNALGGYRFDHLPISREDVMKAIAWAKGANKL
ncbi:MAG TPA: xanthine dehydrogenase family protein molybdopterin-binding subunit [Conexivisphaerales archaeon]|nr:xanthine dehydrogenase family protein molybdopterin-binding subunit [Conexivisphaerales archaeon]